MRYWRPQAGQTDAAKARSDKEMRPHPSERAESAKCVKKGRHDQAAAHALAGLLGGPQPIRSPLHEGRQLQTERQANWARGRKVKPDQDPTYRSTGHPYVSAP